VPILRKGAAVISNSLFCHSVNFMFGPPAANVSLLLAAARDYPVGNFQIAARGARFLQAECYCYAE